MLGAKAAHRQGVRLVSFNRPGYGRSTDSPPSLASVGLDSLHVTEALGITAFAVLGVSGGGPYALATGLADPERVRAVGVAAGIGPWRLIEPSDEQNPDLPLLALADAGDVSGALTGFRAQGGIASTACSSLSTTPWWRSSSETHPMQTSAGWTRRPRCTGPRIYATPCRPMTGMPATTSLGALTGTSTPGALVFQRGFRHGDLDRMVPTVARAMARSENPQFNVCHSAQQGSWRHHLRALGTTCLPPCATRSRSTGKARRRPVAAIRARMVRLFRRLSATSEDPLVDAANRATCRIEVLWVS